MKENIRKNLQDIQAKIQRALSKAGKTPSSVTLIGVSKTVTAEIVKEAIKEGLSNIGENYVQEAKAKKELIKENVTWHMIGHLQTNKAKAALEIFDWIHTVDRIELAKKLDKLVKNRSQPFPVLIQVNIGYEKTKSGVTPEELERLYQEISLYEGIQVRGLMVIPPYFEDPEFTRPYFRKTRELLDRLRNTAKNPELLTELSMGMSHDFEIAIEEGATMVRIGTAIFGERTPLR